MKKLILFTCVSASLFMSLAFAKHDKVIPTILNPLTTSQWFLDNPGNLPYKECKIEQNGIARPRHKEGALIMSNTTGTPESNSPNYLLVCRTPSLSLQFAIPVSIQEEFSGGPQSYYYEGENDYKVYKLAGRKLSEVFDEFHGFEAGIGVVGSVSGGGYRTNSDIKLSHACYGMGLGVKLGYAHLRIVPRNPTEEELRNPIVMPLVLSPSTLAEGVKAYDASALTFKKVREGTVVKQ